jgi:hypothetical protein
MVTEVPPARGPVVGEMLVTVGVPLLPPLPVKVKSSAAVVSDVCPPTVTLMSTVPADSAGLSAVQLVVELQTVLALGTVPKSMVVLLVEKRVPVIVTTVPPDVGPELGLTAVMVGVTVTGV